MLVPCEISFLVFSRFRLMLLLRFLQDVFVVTGGVVRHGGDISAVGDGSIVPWGR